MQDDRAQAFMTTLTQHLAAVRPETVQRQITERSRLTGDLGLDSVELAELFAAHALVFAIPDHARFPLEVVLRLPGDSIDRGGRRQPRSTATLDSLRSSIRR